MFSERPSIENRPTRGRFWSFRSFVGHRSHDGGFARAHDGGSSENQHPPTRHCPLFLCRRSRHRPGAPLGQFPRRLRWRRRHRLFLSGLLGPDLAVPQSDGPDAGRAFRHRGFLETADSHLQRRLRSGARLLDRPRIPGGFRSGSLFFQGTLYRLDSKRSGAHHPGVSRKKSGDHQQTGVGRRVDFNYHGGPGRQRQGALGGSLDQRRCQHACKIAKQSY